MATFVHIFPAAEQKKIISLGIKPSKIHYEEVPKGIFCMPVIQDFYATHQWVREMMRVHKNLLAVYFRIPDTQEVWYGHYNSKHEKMTANFAIESFSKAKDKMGYQVILPCAVTSSEIIKIKKLPPMGWRYYPEAKGKKLTCFCPSCITKGEYGKNVLLESRLSDFEKKFFAVVSPEDQASAISAISDIVCDHKMKIKSWTEIVKKADVSNTIVLEAIGWLLLNMRNDNATKVFLNLLPNTPAELQADFALSIILSEGEKGILSLGNIAHVPEVATVIKSYREDAENEA